MSIELTAQTRTVTGKNVRFLRRQSIVPVVVYGPGISEPINAQVNEKELGLTLRNAGGSHLIDLKIDGRLVPSLVRAVQHDLLTKRVTHVDFHAVRMDQTVTLDIPVRLVGESPIIENEDAILTHPVTHVSIEVLPRDLVGHLDLDLSALKEVGSVLTVADLQVPTNITVLTPAETVLAVASAPTLATQEEEAGMAEPELVGERKDAAEEE